MSEYLSTNQSYSSLTNPLADLLEVDIDVLKKMKIDEFLSCLQGGTTAVTLALAKALYRSFFTEAPSSLVDSYGDDRAVPLPAPNNGYYPWHGVLNFRSLIKSIQLPKSRFITSIPIEELKDRLERYTKTEQTSNLKALFVVTLDVSFNELMNEDMPFIISLVKELECPVVKLRFNRLGVNASGHNYDLVNLAIQELLEHSFTRFIDISGNNMVDINNKPFFQNLTEKQLSKLIFVHRPWLSSLTWRTLIENPQKEGIVFAAHRFYYSEGDDPFFKQGQTLDMFHSIFNKLA